MPKWWNEQQVCGTYTREAYTVGARTGEKGAHVGHARPRGRHGQGGARGKAGARSGGVHGQGARTCAPLMVAAAPATWVAWAHTHAPIIGAQTEGAHGSKEGPIYVLPCSFEFAKPSPPSSLLST
jgi:hypothetical protein